MADVFCLSPLFFVFLQSFRALVPQMRDDEEVPKRLIKRNVVFFVILQSFIEYNKNHYNERFIQMA